MSIAQNTALEFQNTDFVSYILLISAIRYEANSVNRVKMKSFPSEVEDSSYSNGIIVRHHIDYHTSLDLGNNLQTHILECVNVWTSLSKYGISIREINCCPFWNWLRTLDHSQKVV